MRLKRGYMLLMAGAVALATCAFLLTACEEDTTRPTQPKVEYNDQTFSLLVCDGNGNADTPDRRTSWDHDGAAVCTLDWNDDGEGPNRVPVNYAVNVYPLIDGVAEQLNPGIEKGGDYWAWEKTPWTVIKTGPVIGKGSGVKQVEVKALYTYVNPPRIWFFFRWEDPTHTIQPNQQPNGNKLKGGTMEWFWYQKGGFPVPGDGFKDNHQWGSHEDWLALVWSTWYLWNTNDKGKDKQYHTPADPETSYDWKLVETVPGFQEKGIRVLETAGDIVYRTPKVNTSDTNTAYGHKFYTGPVCDFWYFSATTNNYTAAGGWVDTDPATLSDCKINRNGFKFPPVGSNVNIKAIIEEKCEDWLPFDGGISSFIPNGIAPYPGFQAPDDTDDNPPGAYYLWNAEQTLVGFQGAGNWPKDGGARISAYITRPSLGSVSDVICRCQWQLPKTGPNHREGYTPWEGRRDNDKMSGWTSLKDNYYGKDFCYTLEVMRNVGTIAKIDPTEDVLLGIFDPHPGE
jgi:hypothetical protein